LTDNSLELIHLGDITINAGVTNPIIFNAGVRLRVPNSTDQRVRHYEQCYGPQGNALFQRHYQWQCQYPAMERLSGRLEYGHNTIARIDDSPNSGTAGSSGAILITKVGSGTWIFSGANDLPQKTSNNNIAKVAVTEGTPHCEGRGRTGWHHRRQFVRCPTEFADDGVSPGNLGMTLRNGGIIRMNGSGTLNGLTVGNQAGNNCTLSTVSAPMWSPLATLESTRVVWRTAS